MTDSSVLVLVAKWPGSGASKTRLASQLIAAGTSEDDAKKWTAEFTACLIAAIWSLGLKRLPPWCSFALLYSPPVDEARAYFSALLDEADCSDYGWILMPVLASWDPRLRRIWAASSPAAVRAKEVTGAGIVAFCGSDCPELPGSSVKYCLEAAFGSTDKPAAAAICPATDGGFTLLALPAHADPAQCFSGVKWSAPDTCLSQLAALSRAGLLCVVGETHADVDELDDLKALKKRLDAIPDERAYCECTRKLLSEMTSSGVSL